jgi:hypothetical protein
VALSLLLLPTPSTGTTTRPSHYSTAFQIIPHSEAGTVLSSWLLFLRYYKEFPKVADTVIYDILEVVCSFTERDFAKEEQIFEEKV